VAQSELAGGSVPSTSGVTGRSRSWLTITGTLPPGTPINVNGSQSGTQHKGDTNHNLGNGNGDFQTSLGLSRWIWINGVNERVTWESPGSFSIDFELRSPTKIEIDTRTTEVLPWSQTFPDARFSHASGGYGGFSSSGNYAAITNDEFTSEPTWRIVGQDGSNRVVSHPGGTMFDFMWRHVGDEYYWVDHNSDQVSRHSVDGTLLSSISLPPTLGGENVQWRGTIINGETAWSNGFTASDTWVQHFDESGLLEPAWSVSSLAASAGRPETRFANVWQRGEHGLGFTLSGPEQARLWLSDWAGTQIVEHTGGRVINITPGPSFNGRGHTSFDQALVNSVWTGNVWEVWDVSDFNNQFLKYSITQQDFRDALGISTFVQANHADIRNNRIVFSAGQLPNNHSIVVWKTSGEMVVVAAGITQLPTTGFDDQVRPSISQCGNRVIFHDGLDTTIATVPDS